MRKSLLQNAMTDRVMAGNEEIHFRSNTPIMSQYTFYVGLCRAGTKKPPLKTPI